jgi:hypothetical protein
MQPLYHLYLFGICTEKENGKTCEKLKFKNRKLETQTVFLYENHPVNEYEENIYNAHFKNMREKLYVKCAKSSWVISHVRTEICLFQVASISVVCVGAAMSILCGTNTVYGHVAHHINPWIWKKR